MQGKSIVSDKYRARLLFATRFGAGSDMCRRLQSEQAGTSSLEPKPEKSALVLNAVERLIAAQAAARSAGGHR
jgi:hypothetical protein